jgi:ketosteroid isomerase-like protein
VSEQNVAVVEAIYAAWADGLSAGALIADDMEYVNPPYAMETGTGGDRRTLARIRDVYPDFRVVPERYIDAGEEIVVIGTARGTSTSGVEMQWRQAYIWTVRDGRAVRFRWFNDPAEALEAVGLSSL